MHIIFNFFFKFLAGNCAISHRIINGTEALPKPWVARIHFEHHGHLDSNCGGSLIHPEWILTAKHCLLETKTRLYSKVVNILSNNLRLS